jgi:hypothetical protein
METTVTQHKTPSVWDPSSLTPIEEKVCGGNAHSMEVINGSGKSEFSTEKIAVVVDSREPRSALEDKSVVKSPRTLATANGTR